MKNILRNSTGKFLFLLSAIFLGYLFFQLGYVAGHRDITIGNITSTYDKQKPSGLNFSLYWEAWNKMKDKSVFDVSDEKKVQGSISGLLQSASDPYTVYLTPEDNKRFKEDIQGEFSGIGVEIIQKNSLPTVVTPLSGTPAEKAGLKPGDIIAEVDGVKTTTISFDEVINKIRGLEGSIVKLKVVREGKDKPIDFEVKRENIQVNSVEWKTITKEGKNYSYVKIRQFGDDTLNLFDQFANEAVKNRPAGIIVDLRNNPGGYLTTAIDLSSYFIDDGNVVLEEGKNNQRKEYKVTKKAKLKGQNVIVLVNKGSASASEILSGAIQDREAGKIIGQTTYGKGSVQELIDLSDKSAVKITVAKWLTPNGRQINEKGIDPDIAVSDSEESSGQDLILDRALEYFKNGK